MLKTLSERARSTADTSFIERCEALIQEYSYMLSFLASGGTDEKRNEFLENFRDKAHALQQDINRYERFSTIQGRDIIFAQIRGTDVNSLSLITRLSDNTLTPQEHYDALSHAFAAILFSYEWQTRDQRMWVAYLTSPDTDTIDAQTLVSAIMLSCRIYYCEAKALTLRYVYETTEDVALRQRCLVGYCVGLLSEKSSVDGNDFFQSDNNCKEINKMLMQLVSCLEADKDGERIVKEIMPDLIKYQKRSGILSDDLIKNEDTALEDILNPGKEEQEMEEVEKSIGKMAKMLKNGSDIFFAEFSNMKRYPFFYKPMNWFMPFTYDHPHLAEARKKLTDVKSMTHIYRNGPFCDSDKYSFTFGLSTVIASLPDNVKEMLSSGEVGPLGTLPKGEEREITPDYTRRMYLQDLYRFYKLSPQLKLQSFFNDEIILMLFSADGMKRYYLDFCMFLMRKKNWQLLEKMLGKDICFDETEEKKKYHIIAAALYQNQGDYRAAEHSYRQAYEADADDVKVLRGYARCEMKLGLYGKAARLYAILKARESANLKDEVDYILAKLFLCEPDDVLNEAFRIDFENENNLSIKRTLMLALACNERNEQAMSLAAELMQGKYGTIKDSDYLLIVAITWMAGDTKGAISLMKQVVNDAGNTLDAEKSYEQLAEIFDMLKGYKGMYKEDPTLIVDSATLI